MSFYWLKEVLKTQHPQFVVLDTYMFYLYDMCEPLNTPEVATRIAIDPMRWSLNKLRAVKAICENDPKQSMETFFFPLERYHGRWTELADEDFRFLEKEREYELKGYLPAKGTIDYELNFVDENSNAEPLYILDIMREYLDEIVWLCGENDIQLILVKTPAVYENNGRYNGTMEYATSKGIPFLEMNTQNAIENMEFDFPNDMCSGGHANTNGATKITSYVGKYITDNYEYSCNSKNHMWESTKEYYQRILWNEKLSDIEDPDDYAECLTDKDLLIFMAVNSSIYDWHNDEFIKKLEAAFDLNFDMEFGYSYAVATSKDGVKIELNDGGAIISGIIDYGHTDYHITSYGVNSGYEKCSILIDQNEYALNQKGLNIVVYDTVTHTVIDSICYNGNIVR